MRTEVTIVTGLARRAMERWVVERRLEPVPEDLPGFMRQPGGCFVSIKTRDGRLRGCIGTLEATRSTLAEEIVRNAVASCSEDPRFPPVRRRELPGLRLSVDILCVPEPVDSVDELDPKQYGIIVQSGYLRGVLLPDLEGVDTVEAQIGITMRKAGIPLNTGFDELAVFRFAVRRFRESD